MSSPGVEREPIPGAAAAADVAAHERRRVAFETLRNPAFDIGVFAGIARVVCLGLECRGVGIGRLVPGTTEVEVLGMWQDGATRPVFRFDTRGTPCERALASAGEVLVIEQSRCGQFEGCDALAELHPESYCAAPLRDLDGANLGLLFAFDFGPQGIDASADSLLRAAAARATAEMLRLRADERAREDEARMRFALEAGHLAMWEWNCETDTWVWNERMAELRGCSHTELKMRYDDGHPDDEVRLLPLLEQFMAGHIDGYEIEYRIMHRTLGWRWINSRTRALRRGADGRPLTIIGVQADIHERRVAEDAARANQRWLELAIDATQLGLWDWDAPSDVITWTPRCAEMLGYAHGELPSTSVEWHRRVHPDDQVMCFTVISEHVRGLRADARFEFRGRRRDGGYSWILNTGRVVSRDASGRALRCVGTWQDITPIKQGERALRESEARLRSIVESSPVGIFLASADGGVVYYSPRVFTLTAPDPLEAFGFDWLNYLHDDDRERVRATWQQFIASPDGIWDENWRAVPRPGVEVYMRARAAAIREDERVLGFAGTLEDITEQHALQVQLQRAQKMEAIGTLTGGIAHDFNNSLATILGFATLARGRDSVDAKLGYYLDTIVQAAEHSRDLVRKLLDFSRSAPVTDVAPLDAALGIDEVVRMLQPVLPSTIRIVTEMPREHVTVLLDATDLQQVLLNLVLNARDAIRGHGAIALTLTPARPLRGHCAACLRDVDDEYVEIAVRDTGDGIAPADLARIFDPFYSTKEVGKGTGMGLAVLHGIVHRADGHVLVESTPGEGTSMRVLLRPAGAAALPAASDAITAPGALPLRRLRVLVVDDEPAVARFVAEWLDAEGQQAETFTDPVAALHWARDNRASFDLLITDQTMPGLTGMELAQALREQCARLPVIVCTGLADRVDAPRASSEGLQVLLKPVPLEQLRAALARAAVQVPA
ncbi:MAG: PAS domain-containing protein [Gammaproteobacteria bacterium]|nr:PAS domain-containing protein [Gammaproteobacteria bacterium]